MHNMKKTIQTIFIFLLFIFSTSLILHAQDTLYYDENDKKTTDKESAKSYCVHTITKEGEVYKYYKMDGTLDYENIYTYSNELKTDTLKLNKRYVENKLYWENPFKNRKPHGNFIVYWENGKIKRKDEYVEGKFIKGICFDETGAEIPFYEFEKMPEFPGGIEKLYEYLSSNLAYPKDARKLGIEGSVIISFKIDKDGSITKVELKSSVFKSLDEEAVRVVTNMPKWEPAMIDRKPVWFYYTLPVRFALE